MMAGVAFAVTSALIAVPWTAPAKADIASSLDQFSLGLAPEVTGSPGVPAGYIRLWDMAVAWRDVNPSPGVFIWTVLDQRIAQVEAAGAKVLYVAGLTPDWATAGGGCDPRWGDSTCAPPDDPATYAAYLTAVMQRYGGRIAAVETWNEANLKTFWNGTPSQMADLTGRSHAAIKALSPATLVFAASTTTRLASSVKTFFGPYAKALQARGYPIDGWTIHTYPAANAGPVKRYESISAWWQVLSDATGKDSKALGKTVWDTEINYGLAGPGAIPDQDFDDSTGAAYLARTYVDSIRQGIAATFWYLWTAGTYGLVGVQMHSGTPLVNDAYQQIRGWTAGATFLSCDEKTDAVIRCFFAGVSGPFYLVMSPNGAPVNYTGARLLNAEPINGVAARPAGDITVGIAPVWITCNADAAPCTPAGASSTPTGPAAGPGRPTDITVTPGANTVTVRWSAPAADGSSPITGYRAYTTGAEAQECIAPAEQRTCTIYRLRAGTPVRVYVKARNANAWSAAGRAPQDVTPLGNHVLPGKPDDVAATAGYRSIDVTWTAPVIQGASPITKYRAYVGASAGGPQPGDESCTASPEVRTCTIKDLPNGTSVRPYVQARNAVGWGNAELAAEAVTPVSADRLPGRPTDVSAKPANRSAVVTWAEPADDGGSPIISYRVYATILTPFRQVQPCTATGAERTCTVTTLTNGASYSVTVAACNDLGCGEPRRVKPNVIPSRS